jgi:hypothetical protein
MSEYTVRVSQTELLSMLAQRGYTISIESGEEGDYKFNTVFFNCDTWSTKSVEHTARYSQDDYNLLEIQLDCVDCLLKLTGLRVVATLA